MAQVDVSDILTDPDFLDLVTLIRRTPQAISDKGRASFTETSSQVYMSVQGMKAETLNREPNDAWLTDAIDVYYAGVLYGAAPGGYADVIVWRGKRYQVESVVENYSNYGAGWTHAVCRLEPVSND